MLSVQVEILILIKETFRLRLIFAVGKEKDQGQAISDKIVEHYEL